MTERIASLELPLAARDAAERRDNGEQFPSIALDRERILVREKGRIVVLKISDIQWIESSRDYVKLYLADKTVVVRATMKRFEGQLQAHQFVRVHRSALVNLFHLREIQIRDGGRYNIVLRNGANIPVSKRQKRQLRATIEDSDRYLQAVRAD